MVRPDRAEYSCSTRFATNRKSLPYALLSHPRRRCRIHIAPGAGNSRRSSTCRTPNSHPCHSLSERTTTAHFARIIPTPELAMPHRYNLLLTDPFD